MKITAGGPAVIIIFEFKNNKEAFYSVAASSSV